MRIIIVGAGAVGKQLARILYEENEVIVIDKREFVLEQLKNELDIMTICGNGATCKSLTQAEVEKADMILAVTNVSESNILACKTAKEYGVKNTIARISSMDYFDEHKNIDAKSFGVDRIVLPEQECANNILDTLIRPGIKETVKLSHADAQMANFQIRPGSPIGGTKIIDLPDKELISRLRICAIVRYGQVIIPRGDTSFLAYDEIYLAGSQLDIDSFIAHARPKAEIVEKVIIAGANRLSITIAKRLKLLDMRLVVVEEERHMAENAADTLGKRTIVLNGSSTDASILEETGIDACDVFIAAHKDNEANILSCLLAKRMGAKRVLAITNKSDYISIIAGMNMIDCGFSPMVAAVNVLVQQIETKCRRTVAILQRMTAEVMELRVMEKSFVAGMTIMDIDKEAHLPENMVFGIIIRGDDLVPATGLQRLQVDDLVVVLTKHEFIPKIEKLFLPKGYKK